jgi:serine/threonine protein kinase/WD40 repeat protein
MPITSAADLAEAVRRFVLLPPVRARELAGLHPRFADARALARELLQRGWLTAYQINHLVAGNGYSLVLGQYVLLERIGEGGMGQVLKARHQRLERFVALKLIRTERLGGPEAVQRFQREARAAARLSHPNLVTVFDADEVAGTHFYAMEYVEGTDLAKLLRAQGPLPVAQACDYVRQAALGLQHAHEQGLVHRDIKPANVMLTTRGVIKVLDLGLARLATAAEGGDATDPMTREGTVLGTPDYMAPEQATDSRTADIRADLYSLGCTLFHLLTGQVPFPGGTLAEKLLKHQAAPPPPVAALRPEVSPELAAVVGKLLAKGPAERYRTPAELAAALEPLCGSRPVAIPVGSTLPSPLAEQLDQSTLTAPGTLAQPKPVAIPLGTAGATQPASLAPWKAWLTKRRLAAVGGALGLLLVVLLVALWPRRPGGPAPPGGPADDPRGAAWPLDNLKTEAFAPIKAFDNWPPPGLVLVLGDHRGRHWGPLSALAYSADGNFVASATADRHQICVWRADEGHELEPYWATPPGGDHAVRCLAFSPKDSRRLLAGVEAEVWLYDLRSGQVRAKLAKEPRAPVLCVAVSPDGERALSGGGTDHHLRVWDLTGNGKLLHALGGHAADVRCVAFSGDGDRAYFSGGDKTLRTWGLGADPGELGRVTLPETSGLFAFTSGGLAASVRGGDVDYADMDRGKFLRTGTGHTPGPHCLALAADGSRLAMGFGWENPVIVDVYDTKTGALLRQFRGPSGEVTGVALSADGRRAVTGSGDGLVRLWDVKDDRELVPRPGHRGPVTLVDLSRDGRQALSGDALGNVYLWDLAGDHPGRVAQEFGAGGPVRQAVLGADGKQALAATEGGTVLLWDLDGGKERRRCATGAGKATAVAFCPEGPRALGDSPEKALRLWDAATGQVLREFDRHEGTVAALALSPDGRRALAVGDDRRMTLWDATTGKPLAEAAFPPEFTETEAALAFSPDGQRALFSFAGPPVGLWSVQGDELKSLTSFRGGNYRNYGLVFRRDGQRVGFSRDGRRVAAAGDNGDVTVWDVEVNPPRRQAGWHFPGVVNGVTFDATGRYLATANGNGTVFILRLPE